MAQRIEVWTRAGMATMELADREPTAEGDDAWEGEPLLTLGTTTIEIQRRRGVLRLRLTSTSGTPDVVHCRLIPDHPRPRPAPPPPPEQPPA